MKVKSKVQLDLAGVERYLGKRFGEGSAAQKEWSRIVFDGSRAYMPKVMGTFENLSYIHSEPVFDQGELAYPGPMGRFLWEGILMVDPETGSAWAQRGGTKIPTGETLTFNQEANPQAGARWTERAANDLRKTWESEFQRMIESGIV
ncbi:MAG: hypothetical protein FWC66_05190 [Oscillospiraceae bacterium]|nr:hypothetical protein [Oscillospiraceae bacterium]